MSKFILALLTGMLITFIVDFFLFLGLKLNYFDFYEIDIFYNVLFADNQNFGLFFSFSILFGIIVIYIANKKLSIALVLILSIASIAPLFETIGNQLGKTLFLKANQTLSDSKHSYVGDVYYSGRKVIHFYDKELNKIIILQKDKLK